MYKIIHDEKKEDIRFINCEEITGSEEPIVRSFAFSLDLSNDEILRKIKELYILYEQEQKENIVVKDNLIDTIFEVN